MNNYNSSNEYFEVPNPGRKSSRISSHGIRGEMDSKVQTQALRGNFEAIGTAFIVLILFDNYI